MSTKQEVQSVGLTEVELLEAAFNEELRCEAFHLNAETVCSVEVTHRLRIQCIESSWRFVCFSAYRYVLESWEDGACECGEDCEDCWKIIPI